MEEAIHFAKGPLFAFSFLIMILGLARLLVIQVHSLIIGKGARLRNAPWKSIMSDAATWLLPVRHLVKGTIVFSVMSFLCHIGMIVVPVFLAAHIILWEGFFKVDLPSIGAGLADYLTLLTIVCLITLLGLRTFVRRQRSMSRPMDYLLLILLLVNFGAGYFASHPNVNPLSWELMMFTHILGGDLLFMIIPFTKLAHIVLYPFDRVSAVHWQLRPGAGDKVAKALFGEEARV
jgi:nitrate reductase gamma subunit